MVFTKLSFKGKTYGSYQIDNNKYYFKKDGIKVVYPYRLVELPDYYVANEVLTFSKNASVSSEDLTLTSHLSFNVSDDTLIITQL